MERNFSTSVWFKLKNYHGFVFNPMQIFDVLYNDESEGRTKSITEIISRKDFSAFASKLQSFGNGDLFESFESIYLIESVKRKDLSELCKLFDAVIDDFKISYSEERAYSSYSYAILIISIIRATSGYFPDELLFKFLHACRKNAILKI